MKAYNNFEIISQKVGKKAEIENRKENEIL